jgi:multiple sugar transport system permease protein
MSASLAPDAAGRLKTPEKRGGAVRREAPYVAATLPAAVILAFFFVTPAIWAIGTSLTDRALTRSETHWIGLDNYRVLWHNPDFPKFIRNSISFILGSAVIGETGLGLTLALLIDHATRCRYRLAGLAYAAVLAAWICPPALAGAIWGEIYVFGLRDGPLNVMLTTVGLPRVDMLGNYPMLSVVIAEVWRGTAFAMVIFLGALQTVPRSMYEAARVDGAGAWRQFVDHTLPSIRHALALVLMMTTIVAMGSFLLILILTNGDPGLQTETLALFAYHTAFVPFEIGYGAAIAVVMLVANLLFALVYLRLTRNHE